MEAVIHVTGAVAVLVVHRGFVVFMAVQTVKGAKVRSVRMAGIACLPYLLFVCSRVDRKLMIEFCTLPLHRGVAILARCWETRGQVIRIGHAVVFRLVTGITGGWRAGELVVHMAIGAFWSGAMSARQWEIRLVVIEHRAGPA